ncbi:hypothetical protein GQ457_05G022970 [Hibiscus cannabinus]
MFDQFVKSLKHGQPVVQAVAALNRALIDKLELSCSDEHKLECVVALLVDEAVSWWETTTLTIPTEKVTWEFFVEEFEKKYIREQHFDQRRKKFLYLKQGSEPIGHFTPPIRYKGPKQFQFENQGRGTKNYSKAFTHQESQAPVRVYRIEGRNNEMSLEVITEGPLQILDREIKRLRNKSVPLVKVLWKNHGVEEVTWETKATMQEQYPHLFYSEFPAEGIFSHQWQKME